MDESMMPDLNMKELVFFRGRVGLNALLKALKIGGGDHVAIQAFTCLAVPEAILATGAHPVYVDISGDGFTMDVDDLKQKLSPKTRAIVVQHTFGIPADMDWITAIAAEHRIPIIEDCCHTLSSIYKGKTVGLFGVGCFYSFEWGKPVLAGIGGSVSINNKKLLDKVQVNYAGYRLPSIVTQVKIELQYRAFSLLYRPSLYWPVRTLFHWLSGIGLVESNYNPVGQITDDFSMRMAPAVKRRMLLKIKELDHQTQHSRWVTKQYCERIHSDAISHPVLSMDSDTIFARYPLFAKNKSELLSKARRACVELAEWYATPVHPLIGQDLEKVEYRLGACPNAEDRCRQVVTLPVNGTVGQRQIDRAVEFLNFLK